MRARNVKPALFKNELLATSDPLHTWIFQGLWCLADREGRLEDRPRRIHLEINPGRAYEGTEAALAWLAQHGFVIRYAHGGGQFIQIVNFTKHQNPHMREPASTISPPGASTEQASDIATHTIAHESDSSTVQAPYSNGAGPALSPSLIPDSSLSERESPPAGLDLEVWNRWEAYKREIRKPIKPASLLAAQRKLAGYGSDQGAVVEYSIAQGYTGLWEPKAGSNGKPKLSWRPPPDESEGTSA